MIVRILGIILIIIGINMLVYVGFNYETTEKVVEIGAISINKTQSHPVRWMPYTGGILIIAGITILACYKKVRP